MGITLPIHLMLPVYLVLQDSSSDQDDFQSIINELVELDEVRSKVVYHSIRSLDKVKRNFDKSYKPRTFQKGDAMLLWDKRRES